MHPGMLPTKRSTVTSRYLRSKMKYASPEADITLLSEQPPQAISHPTTRHDGPDPQTKRKYPLD